jgi:hypothetical protein
MSKYNVPPLYAIPIAFTAMGFVPVKVYSTNVTEMSKATKQKSLRTRNYNAKEEIPLRAFQCLARLE